MCLVSYIPLPEGYLISSNRDEYVDRNATDIVTEQVGKARLYYPQDIKGGSWIIASDVKVQIVVLNGAFENHKRKLPYRKSRGVMMKELFEYDSVVDFFEQYDFVGIEPFTMIIAGDAFLYEFRWDGFVKHVKELSKKSVHVWSSCTLYDHDAADRREKLLKNELSHLTEATISSYAAAHQYIHPEDERQGLKVKLLENLRTISHTQIVVDKEVTLIHDDLLSGAKKTLKI